jgi:hypothetical protein
MKATSNAAGKHDSTKFKRALKHKGLNKHGDFGSRFF